MSKKPRPGAALTDDERLVGLLSDAVDALEAFQAPNPYPGLEDVIASLRFCRDTLARSRATHLDALKEFVREHSVTDPDEGGEIPF